MLDLGEIGTFEAVTCFDDSICYMPDLAHVQQVFEQVYRTLEPGGQFLFDAHSLYQMDELFPGFMYNDKTAETASCGRVTQVKYHIQLNMISAFFYLG